MKKLGVFVVGIVFGSFCGSVFRREQTLSELRRKYDEVYEMYQNAAFRAEILNQLYCMKKEGRSVSDFFKINHLENVAVYGYGVIGRILVEELQEDGVKVNCILDRNAKNIRVGLLVQTIEEFMPPDFLDLIVVTSNNLDEIQRKMCAKGFNRNRVMSIKNVMQIMN